MRNAVLKLSLIPVFCFPACCHIYGFPFDKSMLVLAVEPTFLSQLLDFEIESIDYVFFGVF